MVITGRISCYVRTFLLILLQSKCFMRISFIFSVNIVECLTFIVLFLCAQVSPLTIIYLSPSQLNIVICVFDGMFELLIICTE